VIPLGHKQHSTQPLKYVDKKRFSLSLHAFHDFARSFHSARGLRISIEHAGCERLAQRVRGVTADGEMEFWKQPGLLGQKNGCTRYLLSTVLLVVTKSWTLELLAFNEYCCFDTSAFF
jgi:hypothetical protein